MTILCTLNNWSTFIKERFPLLKSITPLLFLFLASTFVVFSQASEIILANVFICFVVIILFFFRLRVFDEIKDYSTDCSINPKRPLARGLIQVTEAKKIAFMIMSIELCLSLFISTEAFVSATLFCAYSFLMYKEFFLSKWLKPKLATYAITHTFVAGIIPIFIFSALTKHFFWMVPSEVLLFSVAVWMLFNVFEFGRKTFGIEEEKELVESYSKNFGSYGAALCVSIMATAATMIAFYLSIIFNWPATLINLEFLLLIGLLISALIYGYINSQKWGKLFRLTCSIYILFYTIILSLGFIL